MTETSMAVRLCRRALTEPLRPRMWRELWWVVIGLPATQVCAALIITGLALGIVFTPLLGGIVLFGGTLYLARAIGAWHRSLGRILLGLSVPVPPLRELRPGLWNWCRDRLTEPASWRAVAYLLLRLPWSVAAALVVAVPLLFGVVAATYPVTWFLTDGEELPAFAIHSPTWPGTLGYCLIGLVVLFLVPWVLHAVTFVDRILLRSLLGPHTMSERVRELERTRADAVDDATTRLRTIERDLHDGAQAQLVALAMKLGLAKDELAATETDLPQVRSLVDAAHAEAKRTITELRDLARGIRPAGLDAGLDVALSTLAARVHAQVRTGVRLPVRPQPAIETIVYFAAAELITNAIKHGSSSPIDVEIEAVGDTLRVIVGDRGPGGAVVVPGGGLAGIAERVGTVDGRLEIISPRDGPTEMIVKIPLGDNENARGDRRGLDDSPAGIGGTADVARP